MAKRPTGGPGNEPPPIGQRSRNEIVLSSREYLLNPDQHPEEGRELHRRIDAHSVNVTKRYIDGGHMGWAQEIAQRTKVRALDRIHQFEEGTRIDSWMYRIADNIAIDMLRAGRVEELIREPLDVSSNAYDRGYGGIEDLNPEMIISAKDELERVRAAIQQLPPEQRAVIYLIEEGLTYKEIAEREGIPMGTVMSRLARARQALIEATGRVGTRRARRSAEGEEGEGDQEEDGEN